jgi:hypothetical protein
MGFWSEFWAAIKHWSIWVWAVVGVLSTIFGWSILQIVSFVWGKWKGRGKPTRHKDSKRKAGRMEMVKDWSKKNALRLIAVSALVGILFVLGAASYTVQNNLRNKLAQTIHDDNITISDLRNQLTECLGSHRPTVRPADSLLVNTVLNTQTQEVHVLAPLSFVNSGDRPAYQLRIRVACTLQEPTASLMVIPDEPITNPVYPGQQITTSTLDFPIPAPVQGQVVWVYFAVRYSDAASDGHCYEDESWFAIPVGTPAFAAMPHDMKDVFEPIIRHQYGTGPQCQ